MPPDSTKCCSCRDPSVLAKYRWLRLAFTPACACTVDQNPDAEAEAALDSLVGRTARDRVQAQLLSLRQPDVGVAGAPCGGRADRSVQQRAGYGQPAGQIAPAVRG